MIIKMAIIGAMLIGSGIIFSSEINQIFPETTSNVAGSVKNDLNNIKDETIQKAETRIDGTVETVSNEVKDFTEDSADLLSENIDEIAETAQEAIPFGKKNNYEEIIPIEESNTKLTNDESNKKSNVTNESEVSNSSNSKTQTFETLSLTTTQQSNDSVMLRYEDTSSKTISVEVTLRTSEQELFSGIFYASMFETFVDHPTNTPYFIDMTIEHKEYGTISSSAFNEAETPETIINGAFTES